MTDSPRRPGPRDCAVLAVVLAVLAVVAVVLAVTGQRSAPQAAPPAGAASSSSDSVPGPSSSAPASPDTPDDEPPADEPAAEPVAVSIPAIDVRSDLLELGLNADGTVEVPPLERDDKAGWYEPGPEPGAVGPAAILGHVDSAEWGPGVFFDLGALEQGDEIAVTRADGSVAVFAVDRVERHPKDEFPTIDVYGNTDDAQLRLITCGGAFDPDARSYEDNTIAFATLVETREA